MYFSSINISDVTSIGQSIIENKVVLDFCRLVQIDVLKNIMFSCHFD